MVETPGVEPDVEPAAFDAPDSQSFPEPLPDDEAYPGYVGTGVEVAEVVTARTSTGPTGGTGRRKEAIARVRVAPGSGQWTINGRSLEDYFPNKVHQQIVREPLKTVEQTEEFNVVARVHGGGVSGQAGALRLGIARALTVIDPQFRGALKKAGFLTRDARVKERKKYGLKKARKAPQYSKR